MDLSQVRRHWNAFARSNPMWSNLTGPELGDRAWDAEAFFATAAMRRSRRRCEGRRNWASLPDSDGVPSISVAEWVA